MSKTILDSLFDNVESYEDEGFGVYDQGDFEEEDENEGSFVIRGKYLLDGADTLEDAAEMARAYADFLDDLRNQGYELRESIEEDYGFAKKVV